MALEISVNIGSTTLCETGKRAGLLFLCLFFLIISPVSAQISTGPEPAVAITMDAVLDFAFVDANFLVDIFDPETEEFESFEFRGSVFSDALLSGETASPAFNALLGANPSVRAGVSYNPNQMSEFSGDNRFDGRVVTRYRDPGTGSFENVVSENAQISLGVAGVNSNLIDTIDGFGFVSSEFGFQEVGEFDRGFVETPFFDVDLEFAFLQTFGEGEPQSFRQVFGDDADELLENTFLSAQLPESYSLDIQTVRFVDSEGTMLTSQDGSFTLPIADLDKIDRGDAFYSFSGFPNSFGDEIYTLSDGREVTYTIDSVELIADYSLSSAFATTTVQSVIDQFEEDGSLPLEDVPGSFDLPDAMGPPRTDDPVLIGDDEFTLDDAFLFNIELNERLVFDPPVAVGYEYELSGVSLGQGFADILVPEIMGDGEFMISVFDPSLDDYLTPELLLAGTTFDFTAFGFDVTRFSILGIDPTIMLDPDNPVAFPALIGFTGSGTGMLSQTPLTVEFNAIPEPGSLLTMAFVGLGCVTRRRRVSR